MTLPTYLKRFAAALFLAALAVPLWSSQIARAASADDDDYYDAPATRVGRISRLDGEASLRQANSDWEDVSQNAPVFEGDEFFTADGSRMEIQLGGGRYLRLDGHTDVVFTYLDEKAVRVEIPAGTVIVSVRKVDGGEDFQLSAPAAAITIRESGVYRIDVDDDGNTRVGVARDARASVGPHEPSTFRTVNQPASSTTVPIPSRSPAIVVCTTGSTLGPRTSTSGTRIRTRDRIDTSIRSDTETTSTGSRNL